MSEPVVRREDRGPVAVLTLNRPERRNALSRRMIGELGDHLRAVEAAPNLRAVVLTGTGPSFCAGMDMKEAAAMPDGPEAEQGAVADAQALADLIEQVHRFPRISIAALNGDALGGGAGLAMACDFVVAANLAHVGYPEVRVGMVAAIVMHDLVRLVGLRRARTLLLTGAAIQAEEAERWGLVNRVVSVETTLNVAISLARSMFDGGPEAQAATKRQLDEAIHYPNNLRGSAAISAAVRVSDEAREGFAAFVEKRPPRWVQQYPA